MCGAVLITIAAYLAQQSLRSAGQIRCLGCGKVCVDHNSLAQHLKDKHQGLNSPNAPGSTNAQTGAQSSRPSTQFSIADVLTASRYAFQSQCHVPDCQKP